MRYDQHLSVAWDNSVRVPRIHNANVQADIVRTTGWFFCAALAAASLGLPKVADAGAWTLPDGGTLVAVPVSYQRADEAFDGDGNRVDQPRFEMFEFSPYLEYGVSDDFTAGFQPKYRSVRVETGTGDVRNSGLPEADILGRLRLWHAGEAAFSVQGLVKIPIDPDENSPAALGRDQNDVELSLLYGNRHPLQAGGTIFYNVDAGFRKRFDDPSDEIHANAFLGWSGAAWSVVLSSTNTLGLGNEGLGPNVLNQGPNFTRYEAQLGVGYQFTDSVSATGGVATTYAGENVGESVSGFLGLVFRN